MRPRLAEIHIISFSSPEKMGKQLTIRVLGVVFLILNINVASHAQKDMSPLSLLQESEKRNKGAGGEIYLGKILTIPFAPDSVKIDPVFHPFLLELTDVLKTPLRDNYRNFSQGIYGFERRPQEQSQAFPSKGKGPESAPSEKILHGW